MAALFAINTISERVERSSVQSRLEQESLQSARVGSFRVVQQMSAMAAEDSEGYLHIPTDPTVTDRIVLTAFAGQSVARVDIVGPDGTLVYSTDPAKRGQISSYMDAGEPLRADYIGPSMMAPIEGEAEETEIVVSTVPIPREGDDAADPAADYAFIVFRDVTSAIDVATASGNRFRLLTVLGVMSMLFLSLLAVVWRGHSIATAAREQLQSLLHVERELAGELDRRNEDLNEAIESKNQILSVVTHELNNPITAIAGYADILGNNRRGNLNERQVQQADAIGRSARQMGSLVSDLLDYSRIESSTIDLDIEVHDAMTLVRDTADMMMPILMNRSQLLDLHVDDDPAMAQFDYQRCEQVLTNLISNASKYSPEGTTIKVTCEATEHEVVFTVTDRGIGISKEDQEQLFQPFFRADNRETRQMKGTGLGLMISRQIAELHQGSLTLDSEPGSGTTVTFRLPRVSPIARPESSTD